MGKRALDLGGWMLVGTVLSMSGAYLLMQALAPPNRAPEPAEGSIFATVAILCWAVVVLILRLFRRDLLETFDRHQARMAPLLVFVTTWLPVAGMLWLVSQLLALCGLLGPDDPVLARPALFRAVCQPWFPILTGAISLAWLVLLEPFLKQILRDRHR